MATTRRTRTSLIVGAIFAGIAILHFVGWLRPLEIGLREFFQVPLGTLHGFSVTAGDNYQFFKNREEFIAAYQTCVAESSVDLTINAKIKLLEDENKELSKQLAFQKKTQLQLLPAEVIGKEIGSLDLTIILDKGFDAGVRVGQPVIASQGIMVGKIIQVERDISVARLVNDNQSRVGATMLNRDRSLGVVEGGFGISLQMNLIPRDEVVQIGDSIVTSGLEEFIPRGLVLGTVASIENEAYKPFQKAIVTPGVDLSKLTIVSIVSGK